MIELVIACFIGILIGTTTGMIPGIHVNTAFDGCNVNSPCPD